MVGSTIPRKKPFHPLYLDVVVDDDLLILPFEFHSRTNIKESMAGGA